MIIYASLTVITILISLMVRRTDKISYGYSRQQVLNGLSLLSVFLLLFTVSALRMNVGNDYAKYAEYFHLVRCSLDTDNIVVPTEPGFNLVCIIIYLLSSREENYLCMFAVFALVTIILFLKGIYDQADSFPMSFAMFMCLGYYFQTFSTIRYYLALGIAFVSIPYVLNKKWAKFIALIILGAMFHKSVILVIPMYYLAQRRWKKLEALVILGFAASMVVFKNLYISVFYKFYPTYKDTGLVNGGTSYIAIARCLAVLVLSLIMYRSLIKDNPVLMFFFNLNIGALLVYLCAGFLPDVSRAGYYLSVSHILFIPSLINGIANERMKKACKVLFYAGCAMYFIVFLFKEAPANGLRILPYQTFIYHDMVDILSDVL